jgi:hypothetical protein
MKSGEVGPKDASGIVHQGNSQFPPVVRKNLVQPAKCTGFGANGEDFLKLCSEAEVSVRS